MMTDNQFPLEWPEGHRRVDLWETGGRGNRASRLWQHLGPDVESLLTTVEQCFLAQGVSDRWPPSQRAEASALCRTLGLAWQNERVDLDTLRSLSALTDHLGLASTLQCRAALETIHDHFRRVVELTYEELL